MKKYSIQLFQKILLKLQLSQLDRRKPFRLNLMDQ